ncbi:molecular chaperone HtpG [Candidatus Kinetoplastidibacterium crithidiae]|uniref:Chaperone protein HtpG n=1 Tax=Candidatus Kinetoplastidibacterium crithidiae TCC036E TaxID=1208918 RepID=M1LTF4_9PROT|nr:molecular chaperone HtpG [Candidatus Kinetoplastibacterium crithidii]AFZ83104.1 molecular chaperone HtpG [Candidatus Kinetoplastibacterium crithidii (ex Angomonas deanei ATCC 30255)]AGF47381.1 molecular chaperone HtpG [Candidatus Kinetoplastibacterium crithidii TCC036E]
MSQNSQSEKMSFQAEVKQLLHLMIHSLYSNKEIFLRELVSNASDACDKLRFESLDNPDLLSKDSKFSIIVSYDKDKHTITISDNGIGMSREEVINNLGTIAKSGTKDFFKSLSGDKQKDAQLIGQFGVGFYSSFIIADKVKVTTLKAGLSKEFSVSWESDGLGEFIVSESNRETHGTDIELHIKEDSFDLLNGWRLREILHKYSDHISLPIYMFKEEWDDEKKTQIQTNDLEIVNKSNALWARPKSDIIESEYKEFYKVLFHDFEDPLFWTHNKIEGRSEYTQLFFIPKHAPLDIWDRDSSHGIKLYIKRVFIMDDSEQLLPRYLRFVRGIIDTSDLELNVSREILQESKDIFSIKEASIKRILGLLDDAAKNKAEDYNIFWNEFGQILKEGIGEDFANQEKIAKLLRFVSTYGEDDSQYTSLSEYVSRMDSKQEGIYYITADSLMAAKNSPHLEIFRKNNIEVLLLPDRIDEWMISHLRDFNGKPLISIAKEGFDVSKISGEVDIKNPAEISESSKSIITKIENLLKDRVKSVKVSSRLIDSPACILVEKNELSPHMVRILKAAGQNPPDSKLILEVNPDHDFFKKLSDLDDADFEQWSNLLLDQAILTSGGNLNDPVAFVRCLNSILLKT